MKKNLLIILTIVLAIALIGTACACVHTEKPTNTNAKMQELDFITAVNTSENNTISIFVKQGETQIYSYVNGRETKISEELELSQGSFSSTTTAAPNYSATDFSNSTIEESDALGTATFTADIASPAEFLGISGQISNAKIVITIDKTTKKLQKITINYDTSAEGYDFSVELIIMPQ